VSVTIPENRKIAREGVNSAKAFFERHDCVFVEIPQQDDFGKDAYVDIGESRKGESSKFTHLCAALQIKSGESYRAPDGNYFVPVEKHGDNWRRSTVPVFGLVYDPADHLIRWADLTAYLRAHPEQEAGRIPISRHVTLTDATLRSQFVPAVMAYAAGGGGAVALNLLSAGRLQLSAVFDAWALGRQDAKFLILLRRLILELEPDAVCRAIHLLAHAGDHPNIFWTKDSWIPPDIGSQVLPSFRWSPAELVHMIRAVPSEDYGYGTLGESLDVLLYEDRAVVGALRPAIGLMLAADDLDSAVRGATLVFSHSKDARGELALLTQQYPALMDDEWFSGVAACVEEEGKFSLY
jgi:hypothetical protein